MPEVNDARGLLLMAVRDLFDAEQAMVDRLPDVRSNVSDPSLKQVIADDETASAAQRDVLDGIARKLDRSGGEGQRNIWQRAILDDAANDASTIERGKLLDIALAGALRKGKQSERVSYETAIALAEHLGDSESAAALSAIRDTEAACDAALAHVLQSLASAI